MFRAYLRRRIPLLLAFALFCAIFLAAFVLYHIPAQVVLYPALLCAGLGAVFLLADFLHILHQHKRMEPLKRLSADVLDVLPPADSLAEEDYQEIIHLLCQQQRKLETDLDARFADMVDYYTVWAHQIKTPIASMRLHLQNEDSPFSRQLSADLFRIEQYVEMVLMFLRLDSDSTDYVIREYDLDRIIKQAVRKFSPEFIRRKLRLDYTPLNVSVITDEKWLSFVLEQVLSNALKYTNSGSISIFLEAPCTLCIRDTGIGIAPEDLHRIFEKGYTGYNGRRDKTASGIGLYLCRRICQNLGHPISAQSVPDQGTVIRIDLQQDRSRLE